MGASGSKNSATVSKTNMEFVLDEGVKKNIDQLQTYVSQFNDNNVDQLMNVVKKFPLRLKDKNGNENPYDFGKIEQFVQQFHTDLLKHIQKNNANLSRDEISEKMKEKVKDKKNLPDYLKGIYTDNLEPFKQEILKNDVVSKDAKLKSNIESILNNITGLKSKYRYFEYQYIQLNLFLIIFIQHTFHTLDKFIGTVMSYTVNQNNERSDSIRKLVDLLINIMNQANLQLDQENFDAIDNMMNLVESEIKKKQGSLQKAIDNARVEAMDEMIRNLVNAEEYMKRSATGAVEESSTMDDSYGTPSNGFLFGDRNKSSRDIFGLDRSNSQSSNSQSSNSPFGYNPNQKQSNSSVDDLPFGSSQSRPVGFGLLPPQNYGLNATKPNGQQGGFLKGHSLLPQQFYKLANSSAK
jgi:hypothetical protein